MEKDGVPDKNLTADNLRAFLLRYDVLLRKEVSLQNDLKADLVVTDIDPLPVKAAAENGIPAVGISNFTWDWILQKMCPEMEEDIRLISEMYSTGLYLRLPMGPDYSPCKNTVEVPLLRGGPAGDPSKVEQLLGDRGKRCLVALRHLPEAFGDKATHGMSVFTSLPEPLCSSWLNITPEELEANGATFADLVAAADIVVTKPGYGIVSQIRAMGKRAVLKPLEAFPEEEYILKSLEDRRGIFIEPGENLYRGCSVLLSEDEPEAEKAEGSCTITGVLENKLL